MARRFRYELSGSLLLLFCVATFAQPADPYLGVWRSNGYAEILEIVTGRFRVFSETTSSLVLKQEGKRSGNLLYFDVEPETGVLVVADGSLNLWRNEFSVGRSYSRAKDRPLTPTANAERALNLRVVWEAFNENYPFFALRGVDWKRQFEIARRRLRPAMTDDEFFTLVSDMLTSLGNDGHVWMRRPDGKRFSGASVNPHPLRELRGRWQELIDKKYLSGNARVHSNRRIFFGRLPNGIAYLGLRGVEGFSESRDVRENIAAFNMALNTIFSELRPNEPLVLDLRMNPGGYDDFSLLIAGRLTDRPKVAFFKQARIQGTDRFEPLNVRNVFPSPGPNLTGPVYLLTSGLTYSGAEIFVMATMSFPNVTRIGENTAGALSDVLQFKLPNGWEIGLSNERYFASDGEMYERRGIPPHVESKMTVKTLEAGIDPGLETAMRLAAEGKTRPHE